MEELSPDLNTKYTKLATEFSKLRAQVVVLKKALADEQINSTESKRIIKERDQTIRKLEQEIESLNFRNLQLAKRIGVLQEDLDLANVKKGPKIKVSETSILSSELQSRIEENEKLHQKVSTSQLEYQQQINDLTVSLEKLQSEFQQKEENYIEKLQNQEEHIKKLTEDKAKLELSLKNCEKELKEISYKEEVLKEKYDEVKENLSSQLAKSEGIIRENIPFLDTRLEDYNVLNLPLFYKKHKRQIKIILNDMNPTILDILRSFSELHIYICQREELLFSGDIHLKLQALLKESSPLLKNFNSAIEDFFFHDSNDDEVTWIETLTLDRIVETFTAYTKYFSKLVPYFQNTIEEDTKLKSSMSRLVSAHENLSFLTKRVYLCFSRIETWLKFMHNLEGVRENIDKDYKKAQLMKLYDCITELRNIFKEIKNQMSIKLMVEHQLPTITDKQKTTDECILASIVSFINNLTTLATQVSKLAALYFCPPYSLSPAVTHFRKRAISYMKSLDTEDFKTIPYEQALNEHAKLEEIQEHVKVLHQQLSAYKVKIAKLEEDKENYILECQLLQSKLDKSDAEPQTEKRYHLFLKSRVSNLVAQMQYADSRAIFFQTECAVLQQKVALFEKMQKELMEDIEQYKHQYSELQIEQNAVVKSYEEQLHAMSEHLAYITEQYSSQKQELEQLRHGNKKSNK